MDTAATTHAARYLKTEHGQAKCRASMPDLRRNMGKLGKLEGLRPGREEKKRLFATAKSLTPGAAVGYAKPNLQDLVRSRTNRYDLAPTRKIW